MLYSAAFQATAFQNNAFQIGTDVVPIPPITGGGGASKGHARRLRESLDRRARFEDERRRRIAAIGDERRDPLTMEPAPLVPAPETMEMLNRLLYEPITREVEQPNPPAYEDDGGEEELLLLLLAD
jgi:hypothetical protein